MDAKELETAIAKGIFKGLVGVFLILFVGWISSPIWMPLGLIAGEYLIRNWDKINWNSVLRIVWWYGVSWGILYLLDFSEVKKLNIWNLGSNTSGLREFALLLAFILYTAYAFFPKAISINPFLVITCLGLLAYIASREKNGLVAGRKFATLANFGLAIFFRFQWQSVQVVVQTLDARYRKQSIADLCRPE